MLPCFVTVLPSMPIFLQLNLMLARNIRGENNPPHPSYREMGHCPSKMNLQKYLSFKESFLQIVSPINMSYTVYIKRSQASILNLYNSLKKHVLKPVRTKFQKACLPLLHYQLHCLDCIRLVERFIILLPSAFLSEVRNPFTNFQICLN